jgi:hypothetical protein
MCVQFTVLQLITMGEVLPLVVVVVEARHLSPPRGKEGERTGISSDVALGPEQGPGLSLTERQLVLVLSQ